MERIGIPISHIKELLCHECRKTTEGYIHAIGSAKTKAIEQYQETRRSIIKNIANIDKE